MDLKKALADFKAHNDEVRQRRTTLQDEVNGLNNLIWKTQETIEEKKKELALLNIEYRQMHTHLLPALAREIAEHLGMEYELFGPSGIFGEMTMYFHEGDPEDPKHRLVLRLPRISTDTILYLTGRITNEHEVGRVAFAREKNFETAPLPETVEEIVSMLRSR